MLYLIGIGLNKNHITDEMIEKISSCKKVFLEYYTSFYESSFEEIEEKIHKKISVADRNLVETQIEKEILFPAKEENIALLVIGDPLIATTHTDLLLRSKEIGIKTQTYNNLSIGNTITRTGLQFYKFGKITSIPYFTKSYMPRTPYMIYIDNHRMGAHSLFLLDLDPIKNEYLKAHQALQFLLDIPKVMQEYEELEDKESELLDENSLAIICSRLGFKDEQIFYGNIKELIELDKEKPLQSPVCLIIPGDLHEMEEKYLDQFRV